jgi:hypothetical protein
MRAPISPFESRSFNSYPLTRMSLSTTPWLHDRQDWEDGEEDVRYVA